MQWIYNLIQIKWLIRAIVARIIELLLNVKPNEGYHPFKVRKRAKTRNRYNQAPHLTQDTIGKVTNLQLDITHESQEACPFPAGDHMPSINRLARKYNKKKKKKQKKKTSQKYHT